MPVARGGGDERQLAALTLASMLSMDAAPASASSAASSSASASSALAAAGAPAAVAGLLSAITEAGPQSRKRQRCELESEGE